MQTESITDYNLTKRKSGILTIALVVFYVLSNTMPIIGVTIRTEIYLVCVLCIYAISFFGGQNLYRSFNNAFLFTLPLLLYTSFELLFSLQYKTYTVPMFFWKYGLIIIPPILAYYLLINDRRNLMKIIVSFSVIGFVATAITSFIGLLKYPDAARWLATVASSKDEYFLYLERKNIGGYEIVYSIVLIFPMIVCLYKHKVIKLIPTILITGAFICYLVHAQYAMALITFFLSFILFFIGKDISVKKLIILLVILILLFFVFSGLLVDFLQWLASVFNSKTLSDRFLYISNLINGTADSSNELSARQKLYNLSIQSFFQKPFFGWWETKRYANGGHSFILDYLANFGILGGISLFIMIRHLFMKLYYPFRNTSVYAYMLWSFVLYIFIATFNTASNFLFTVFFIVPLMGFLMQGDKYKLLRNTVQSYESNVAL